MSHTSRRTAPPIECPLASLGHNTTTLDSNTKSYHHPLSSSPLNPQVYQMSRNSPILNISSNDNMLYTSSPSVSQHQQQQQQQHHNQYNQMSVNKDHHEYGHKSNSISSRSEQPPLNYTSLDSILSYRVQECLPNSYHSSRGESNMGSNSINNNVVIVNHRGMNNNDQYFIEDKMESLYLSNEENRGHYKNTERYYLEDDNMMCSYPASSSSHHRIDNNFSPNFLRRTSSPSETSGSDRYLLADRRTRASPAIFNNGHNSYNYKTNKNIDQPTTSASTISVEQFLRLGRFSPNLDQGYATLVSPSPSGPQTPGPWNKHKNMARFECPFDTLPDKVLLKIFYWLDSCDLCNITRVCRRFSTLVWKPILWKTITLKGDHISGDKALKAIFRRLCSQSQNGACPDVERVMLNDGCRVTDKGLQLLGRRCPELTHLQIQFSVNITNNILFDIVTKCTNLQHLDIAGCSQITTINFNLGFDPPRRLFLQYLDLTDCCAINDEGLHIIVRNCPQLVYLYLRRCVQLTDSGLKFVPSFCLQMRELSVSDCCGITDFGLYELAKLGATLRYLSVAKCDQVSDAGLKVIARRCYKLRYLNARGCEAVSDDSITVLARSCPRLRALDIGKCDVSDAGLKALAESCPNLKKLSLKNCDMISDRGIQCIAYYCRGLQQLNIQDCQISLEGYRAVKRFCKRCVIEHTNPGFY